MRGKEKEKEEVVRERERRERGREREIRKRGMIDRKDDGRGEASSSSLSLSLSLGNGSQEQREKEDEEEAREKRVRFCVEDSSLPLLPRTHTHAKRVGVPSLPLNSHAHVVTHRHPHAPHQIRGDVWDSKERREQEEEQNQEQEEADDDERNALIYQIILLENEVSTLRRVRDERHSNTVDLMDDIPSQDLYSALDIDSFLVRCFLSLSLSSLSSLFLPAVIDSFVLRNKREVIGTIVRES
jgi:hypothetical protein